MMRHPLGPIEGVPRQVAEDLSAPTRRPRREFRVNLYPDEYMLLKEYCRHRRSPMATMARQILLAYLGKMIARAKDDLG